MEALMREEENGNSIVCPLEPQQNYKKVDISEGTICLDKNEIRDVEAYLS